MFNFNKRHLLDLLIEVPTLGVFILISEEDNIRQPRMVCFSGPRPCNQVFYLFFLLSGGDALKDSKNMELTINAILVPQGAEHQAVCRGLRQVPVTSSSVPRPQVFAIPIGPEPVTQYLQQWDRTWTDQMPVPAQVLMMGLCGSLTAKHNVGDVVFYGECYDGRRLQSVLTSLRPIPLGRLQHQRLGATSVIGITCDHIIHAAAEKRQLAITYGAEVVDMEGFAALAAFQKLQVPVTILRIVSDDAHHDLPDLTSALTPEGQLQPCPLALNLLRQPIAATRLIRGSLRSLQVLSEVTTRLFCECLDGELEFDGR